MEQSYTGGAQAGWRGRREKKAPGSGLPTPERENNRDAHPLPDITEILDQLGQSKYFTCLDMVMGYHQIEVEEGEGPKTAFSTKQGHWE